MSLWAASFVALRWSSATTVQTGHAVFVVEADCRESALGKAARIAVQTAPERDGWGRPRVAIVPANGYLDPDCPIDLTVKEEV